MRKTIISLLLAMALLGGAAALVSCDSPFGSSDKDAPVSSDASAEDKSVSAADLTDDSYGDYDEDPDADFTGDATSATTAEKAAAISGTKKGKSKTTVKAAKTTVKAAKTTVKTTKTTTATKQNGGDNTGRVCETLEDWYRFCAEEGILPWWGNERQWREDCKKYGIKIWWGDNVYIYNPDNSYNESVLSQSIRLYKQSKTKRK